MKRSKLEIYLDILAVLALKGQLKLTHLMSKSNVNCKSLKELIDFLIKNGLVEKKILKKEQVVYALTPNGMAILKAFREINQVFPIGADGNQQDSYSKVYFSRAVV
jgi:predicted transcriptional regulator